MKISYIKEAPLLRAYLLINQEKNKKNAFKSIQTEISKMSEVFGPDFDRNLHLILFNDIDFKDPKTFQKTKDRKIEYFLQDFPQFIERPDFTEIFSRILMDTKNQGSASEIFNGLNKKFKFSIENQMRLLISFFLSDTERYQEEAKNILLEKCKEIYKDKKLNNLTEPTINTLLTILDVIRCEEDDSGNEQKEIITQIDEFYKYFMDFNEDIDSCQTSADDIKQISDLDKRLDTGNEEPVEIEKLFIELGPFICFNKINISNSEMINAEIDVDRLGFFIIYMLNHPKIKLDEELKELNKVFLESLIKTSTYSSSNSNNNMTKEDYKNLLEQNLNKELKWDLDYLYKLFKKNIDNMDVNQILNALDAPLFCVKDKNKFEYLIEILQKLNILKEENDKNLDRFFKNLIFTKWNNEINQIEFIDFMINNEYINENSFYSLKNYNGNKIPEEIDKKILQKYNSNSNIKNQYLIENWKNMDLIEILLQLSKGEFYNSVKEIFKWPIQNIPEIFSLTLVNSSPDLDAFLYDELTYEVIQKVLTSKTNDKELLDEIWNSNKNLIITILAKMWNAQPDIQNMSKIFEIIKNKIPENIPILVNSRFNHFSINLAIFASKRDFLNLKQWLKERINKVDDEFIEAILFYIKKNIISQVGSGSNSNNNNNLLENAQLSSESIAIILENVMRSCDTGKLSQKTKLHCKEVFKSIFEIYEEIQIQSNNLEEIDKEVNQILYSMFKGEITVDSVVEKLINYRKSENEKEVKEYLYLIRSLFDEYHFYPQYPEVEIKKVAELFGKIIFNEIIDGILVTIALKYILEGIKTGKGNMYIFGTVALDQFVNKISNWPNFMNSLIDVPQIKTEKDLYQKLLKQFNESKKKEKGINSGDSRDNEGESLIEIGDKNIDIPNVNEFSEDEKNMAKQYNKLKNKLSGPAISYDKISKINTNQENQNLISEEIINKIKFIFCFSKNSNIADKIKDLKAIFKDENKIKWFSQYFVNILISTENVKFFKNYYEIFDKLKNKELHKEIIKATIKAVIKNVSITCDTLSSENRAKENLKNLGLWLSEYKISKDRPILAKDLDFKTLIINSCENGNLNLVIPFVSCVFKYASFSKVFKSTNPWVCSILNLMAELNSNPILEQSVKTEIKNLFKNLKADINTWPKTNELEKCNIKVNSPYYGHEVDKEFINKRIKDPALADYINNLLGIFNSDPNINNQRFSQRKNNSNNNNINPNNEGNYFYNTDNISNLLKEVMINSIQEIIPEIIDKNVKSSIMTSIFLVNKDFMFEKDENKYISSLENTMNVLAMSLSTMNSKELMKQYINMEFDKILVNKNLTKKTIEKIKQQPKSEFLSIGLDYIQNFINKEAPKILRENSLVKEVLEKRRQNNMNNNSGNNVFIDNKHYKDYIKVMKILPDKLHPNETCITDEEFKIYENFGKLFESMNKSIKEENGRNSFMNTIYRILKEVLDNTATNKARIVDYDYDFFMKNIQNVSHNNDFNNDENDLICLEKIVSECKITDKDLEIELAKKTLDYAVKNIKSGNILWLNVYSHILKGWVTLNPEISEEIIKYLLGLEDIFLRYKFDIYHNFLKKKVIDYEKLEKYLIEILNNNSSDLLVRDLFEKLFQKTKTPHSYYFDHNSKYYYALFSNKSQICSKILDKINNPILNLKHSEQNNLGKFATFVLDHLTKYYLKNEDNKDVLNILKNEMNEMKNDTIKSESKNKAKIDMMAESNLYKIILIICEMCIKGPLENQKGSLYSCYPENLAISIYIIVYMQEKTDKLKLFTKIINYIMNFFERDYIRDVKDNFINQRGYFRFFYNLIYLLNMNQSDELFFDSEHKRVNYLYQISDFLKKNSPVYFTGFAMGWLELISCNIFISNFLEKSPNPQHQKKKEKNDKYEKYLSLLIELLNYLDSLNQKVISDYNYIIFLEQVHKFFFLLVNSYPEFISKYYYQLITCLSGDSSTFIQLKNILLSANPDNMPENDNDNINITLTNEEEAKNDENENENNLSNIKKTATILFDSGNALEENRFKNYIDKYINEQNENYLSILVKNLEKISDEKESNKICNMIIIYWSQSKYKYNLNEKSIRSKEIIYRFYEYLLLNLSKVQRDMLINAILNSLRFPCVQTFAYSVLFQTLFFEIKNEEVIEHMLNNILIRLIYKPLPWGLKFTFINMNETEGFQKLIKPYLDKYNLWEAFCNILNGLKKNDLMNAIDLE